MSSYVQLHARCRSVAQLGSMVNAMRGIAAARAQQSRQQLAGVQAYAEMVADSIGCVLDMLPRRALRDSAESSVTGHAGAVVLFCAEHGFAGAFSERILANVASDTNLRLLIVGTRGVRLAQARGWQLNWSTAMISQQSNASKLADRIAAQLYALLHSTDVANIDVVYARPDNQQGYVIVRHALMPLDYDSFSRSHRLNPPLLNLPPLQLLECLGSEYLFARINEAIMHSYAAENAARLQTMTAARDNISQRLSALSLAESLARQEDITAEIIELAAGKQAMRES